VEGAVGPCQVHGEGDHLVKRIAISTFKVSAHKVIDQVAKTKQGLVITRRGKPLAEVVPFRGEDDRPVPGKLSAALVFEKDIVSPLGAVQFRI
jgi:prevent-host-death family protein